MLELTSPTCTCSTSVANVPISSRTACTVTRRSKSTLHHWFVPNAVIEKVELLLSLAMSVMFKSNVLDCVATHALLRAPPQDRAKLSWYGTSWYVGPLYPALHVQFQIDTDAAADALVLAHDVHAVIAVLSAYVFVGQSIQADEPYTDLYLPSAHCTQSGPNAPVYPGLQKHAVRAVAPGSEYEFGEHDWHNQFPVMFLKLPGAHFSHRLAVVPV